MPESRRASRPAADTPGVGRDPRSGPAGIRDNDSARPALRDAIATPEGKQQYVRRLFATIADRYDLITRLLSYGQDRRWKRTLLQLAAIRPDDRVLDLACGTGDILFAAQRASPRRAVGLDLTWRMIQLARAASSTFPAPVAVPIPNDPTRPGIGGRESHRSGAASPVLLVGDMLALPFRSHEFDVVTTGYGLRNVPDLQGAIDEIRRVLAPGGRLLSLDFDRPANPLVRAVYLAYLTGVGSALGAILHGDPDTYRYIPESIRTYPGAAGVARMLEARGFDQVRVIPVLFGLMAIHIARRQP